jgi:DNA polymerase I-like protein with 3'-5' exonuclease and polymerase domains
MKKLSKTGAGACTLCDLHTRVSDPAHICVNDYFPSKSPDIMVILANLPDDYSSEGLEYSEQITELKELIQSVYPNKTVGFTSAVKCSVRPQYIKQACVNKCLDTYFKNLTRSYRASRYIIMGAKVVSRLIKKSCAKGKLYDFQYGKFVVTEPLYLVLENEESVRTFKKNISVLFEAKRDIKRQFNIQVVKTAHEIKAAYTDLMKNAKLMAVDIEASGLPYRKSNVGHRILCVSFTARDNHAYVIPLDSAVNAYENEEDLALAWKAVNKLLASDIKKVFHYGKYDVLYFKFAKNITVNEVTDDSLYTHYLLDERPPHGLKEVTNLKVPSMIGYDDELDEYKRQHKDADPDRGGSYYYVPNKILFPYCGLDTIATWKLFHSFKPELEANEKMKWVYDNIMIPVNQVYMNMESRGIYADREALQEEGKFLQRQINDAQTKVIKYLISKQINANISLNSTSDIARILLELGECKKEELTYSDATKRYSCDDVLISKLIGRGSQICKWISIFRKKYKLKSTYVDAALAKMDKNGRIHANFYLHIASTGRSSVKDPNIQNLPSYIRKFYRAPKGKLMFEFDYSQLELRLMACMSKDPVMLRMYHPDINQDLHALTAAGSKKVVPMETVRGLVMAGRIDDMILTLLGEYKSKFDEILRKRFRRQAKSTNFHMIFQGMVDSLMLRINQDLDKNIREIIMEIERFPERKDALMHQIQDLKDAKVKCVCRDCNHTTFTPFPTKYVHAASKSLYRCPECDSFDVQSDAQEFFDAYFELYPMVKQFQQTTEAFLRQHGYVETVFGRRRHLPDIWSDNRSDQISASNAGSNQPIQSPGADLKFLSLIDAERELTKRLKHTFICCEVHDSIIGETTHKEAAQTYKIIRHSMEKWPEQFPWMVIPFPADCKIGYSWGEMTEIKNAEHLDKWLEENV